MENVSFLTQNFGKYDTNSIGSYMKIGGFSALRRAVELEPLSISDLIASVKVKGRGGAEYDMGRKLSQARAVKGERKVVTPSTSLRLSSSQAMWWGLRTATSTCGRSMPASVPCF